MTTCESVLAFQYEYETLTGSNSYQLEKYKNSRIAVIQPNQLPGGTEVTFQVTG